MMNQHFGICEWSLPVSGPLAIRIAAEIGYDGIQLGEAGGGKMGYPLNHKRVQELYKEAAEAFGIELHSINLGSLLREGALNYARETKEGEYARESLKNGFCACKSLDIHTVVITVEPESDEQRLNVIDHLNYAGRLAETCDVEIAIESAQSLDAIRELLDALDERTKLCMDILNPLRFGTGDPKAQILAFGREKISHFHMKDAPAELFQRGQRGCALLGCGDGGYEETVELIKRLSYQGWLITENYYYLPPMNDGSKDFLQLAREDLATLKRAFT